MWFSVSGILILFLYVNPTVSKDVCSDGMIKDAILSLARIIRENSQKTDRHEVRERHQGDNLKRVVDDLTSKVSILDTFMTHFSKIENQISEIEHLISQRDERERIQMQKTADSIQNLEFRLEAGLADIVSRINNVAQRKPIESVSTSDIMSKLNDTEANFLEKVTQIQSSLAVQQTEKQTSAITERDEREGIRKQIGNLENQLQTRLDEIKNTMNEVNDCVEPTPSSGKSEASDIIAKLNDTEVHFLEKVGKIQSNLDAMGIKNREEAATQAEKLQTVFTEVKDISGRLRGVEKSLEGAEDTAKKEKENSKNPTVDIAEIIGMQSREIMKVTELIEDTLNRIQGLPKTSEIQAMHNETQEALQDAKYTLHNEVGNKINGIISGIADSNKGIQNSIIDLRSDLANNTQRVNEKLNDLAKGQGVMVSTADEVLDTKKRMEYGIHQILLEVGVLIKTHSEEITKIFNDKFDGISNDIIQTQSTALANMTDKMDQELNKVWRQIMVMHQQMTENSIVLDKLNQQSEAYVNDTTSTMDGMETKVSDIKKRMNEVDSNLNYLLGRLSLVTQQFNQIKTGLGTALDDIKASFKEVQEKANDLGNPGPHSIPSDYQESEVGRISIN